MINVHAETKGVIDIVKVFNTAISDC